MSLSSFVHALGRGPSKGRHLTRKEACAAMGLILDGEAAPEAVGALFMLMRYRGETAAEIAGFVDAMKMRAAGWGDLPTALDWPSYAAGRSRGLPWFLLSAKLVANAGHKVLLHGWNSHQASVASVRAALPKIGIVSCACAKDARAALVRDGIAYAPVEALHPEMLRLLKLRDVLGLRSPVNTALRAFNPSAAQASVQGVFHPSYRALQQESAALLGLENLTVIKGGGGEFECNPSKPAALFRVAKGRAEQVQIDPDFEGARALHTASENGGSLRDLWAGRAADPFAVAIVTKTAALALEAVDPTLDRIQSERLASELWASRAFLEVA